MANMLWLNWSGGGNLPPSLGIARVLRERGHEVAFAGRPEMVPRVDAAGFPSIQLAQAYAQVDRYPAGPTTRMACYLTSPAVEEEIRTIVARGRPDVLLIDAMFPAALSAAAVYDGPSAVLFHHFLFRLRSEWQSTDARLNGMRRQAGFAALPPLEELWKRHDRAIVTTLAEFDVPKDSQWTFVRHVGPVLESEPCAVPIDLPWKEADATPIVLVSFSTGPEQRSPEKIQRSLDAVAAMPVHAIVTTAGIVAIDELSVPKNAVAVPYAAHDPILERASLVITHGGHGTLMRSLKHGVPMVVIPGPAHDQAPNGKMLEAWGAGVALEGDAESEAIRRAAETILATRSYADTAKQLAARLARIDGASNAAREIELVASSARTS